MEGHLKLHFQSLKTEIQSLDVNNKISKSYVRIYSLITAAYVLNLWTLHKNRKV